MTLTRMQWIAVAIWAFALGHLVLQGFLIPDVRFSAVARTFTLWDWISSLFPIVVFPCGALLVRGDPTDFRGFLGGISTRLAGDGYVAFHQALKPLLLFGVYVTGLGVVGIVASLTGYSPLPLQSGEVFITSAGVGILLMRYVMQRQGRLLESADG